MLLQTNSYIVPKEKRTEHTRLMRRFRQTLLKLGCDHFEVYEQTGANWSTTESNARFVQILRFVDRKHQLAVQAAERTDPAAQSVIADFCELINFPYQQEQGLFAVGFYNAVLPIQPKRGARGEVVSTVEQEVLDDPGAEVSDAVVTENTVAAEEELSDEMDEPELAAPEGQPEIAETAAHEPAPLDEPPLETPAHEAAVHDTSFTPEEELAEEGETQVAESATVFSGQHMKLVQDEEEERFDAGPLKMNQPHESVESEAKVEAEPDFSSELKWDSEPGHGPELQAEPQTEPQPELEVQPEELEMLEPEPEEEAFPLHSHGRITADNPETAHDSFAGAVAEADELKDDGHANDVHSALRELPGLEEGTEPSAGFEPLEESTNTEKPAASGQSHDSDEYYFIPDEPVEPIRAYAPPSKPSSEHELESLESLEEAELPHDSKPHTPPFPRHEDDTMTLANSELTEEFEEHAHGFIASELGGDTGHGHRHQGEPAHGDNGNPHAGHQPVPKHDEGNGSNW